MRKTDAEYQQMIQDRFKKIEEIQTAVDLSNVSFVYNMHEDSSHKLHTCSLSCGLVFCEKYLIFWKNFRGINNLAKTVYVHMNFY